MKTLIAGVLIAGLAITAQLAIAGTPAPDTANCPAAAARSSSSLNKLLGGLSHGTERTAAPATDTSGSTSGSAATADGWTKGGGASVGKTTTCVDDSGQKAAASGDEGSIPRTDTAKSGVALTVQGNNFTANSAGN